MPYCCRLPLSSTLSSTRRNSAWLVLTPSEKTQPVDERCDASAVGTHSTPHTPKLRERHVSRRAIATYKWVLGLVGWSEQRTLSRSARNTLMRHCPTRTVKERRQCARADAYQRVLSVRCAPLTAPANKNSTPHSDCHTWKFFFLKTSRSMCISSGSSTVPWVAKKMHLFGWVRCTESSLWTRETPGERKWHAQRKRTWLQQLRSLQHCSACLQSYSCCAQCSATEAAGWLVGWLLAWLRFAGVAMGVVRPLLIIQPHFGAISGVYLTSR